MRELLLIIVFGLMLYALWPYLPASQGEEPMPTYYVQESSPTYDCDDATLDMYLQATAQGKNVKVMRGNLILKGESWEECDHLWLIVDGVAFDWGWRYDDPQHYEGYSITYKKLLEIVEADRR